MYKIIFFIALLCGFIFSCSRKDEVQKTVLINYDDFRSTQHLVGRTVEFDGSALRPIRLHLYHDSLLFTVNSGEDQLLQVYNLNTRQKVAEHISLGQGPKEMVAPRFVENKDNKMLLFDVATSVLFEYDIDNFVQGEAPKPIKRVAFKDKISGEPCLLNNTFIAPARNPNYLLQVLNKEGERIDSVGHYPEESEKLSNNEILETYQYSFTTDSEGNVVICYNWTDRLNFYGKDKVLKTSIYGPMHFTSHYKESHNGNTIFAKPVKGETRDAYYNPVSVGDEVFVLFSGKSEDEPDYSILADKILVYSWDGKPEKILSLDQGVFTFIVDAKNKLIYGISDKPEFHIVEFSYN